MLKNLFLWIRKQTSQAIFDGVNDALETLDGEATEFTVSIPGPLKSVLSLPDNEKETEKKTTKKKVS